MKQLLFTLIVLSLIPGRGNAQLSETEKVKKALTLDNKDTVAWLHSGTLNLGLNEGFLHNWAPGGEVASLTVDGLFSGSLTRLYHNHIWTNNLEAAYSLFYAYSNHFVPRKVDDRIDLTSKYGVRIDTAKNFYLTGLFNFKSQFTKGYDYSVPNFDSFSTSKLLSPGYFILAIGLEYRRGDILSLFFSPAAARITVADQQYTSRSPQGAFGIEYNKKSRFELGAYFSGRYQHDFSKKVNFRTRLDLYSNYLARDKKDSTGVVVTHDNPGNVDILWDNILTIKLGKYFNAVTGLTAIYDNDIPYKDTYTDGAGVQQPKNEPAPGLGWWQVKQVLTLGFAVKF